MLFRSPIDSTELGVYRSFDIRWKVEWPRAIRAFMKNPLLGTGYSSLGLAVDNDVLRSLGEVGIFGTLAFALVLIAIMKRLKKISQNSDAFAKYFCLGLIAVLISFVINSLFIDVFEASKVASIFWVLMGLGLSLDKEPE